MADSEGGPWTPIAAGTFPDPRPAGRNGDVVERTVVRLREAVTGRYVRYRCTSWYGEACVLQYVEVIQDSG